MNYNKYDPSHIATQEQYEEACASIPELRKSIEEEEDYYTKIILKVKLGEAILTMMSYLYGLTYQDCEEFSDIVSFWVNKKLKAKKQQVEDLEKLL